MFTIITIITTIIIIVIIIVIIINPHLGLIHVLPLMFFSLKTTFFTIHVLSKRLEIY